MDTSKQVLDDENVLQESQVELVLNHEAEFRKELLELAQDATEGEETVAKVDDSQKKLLEDVLKDQEFLTSLERYVDAKRVDETSVSLIPKSDSKRLHKPNAEYLIPHFGGGSLQSSDSLESYTENPKKEEPPQVEKFPPQGSSEWIKHAVVFYKKKDIPFQEYQLSLQLDAVRTFTKDNQAVIAVCARKFSKTNTPLLDSPSSSWYELQEWTLAVNGKTLAQRDITAVENSEWHKTIEKSNKLGISLGIAPPSANVGANGEVGITSSYEIRGTEWEIKTSWRSNNNQDGAQFSWFKTGPPFSAEKSKASILKLNGTDDLVDIKSKKFPVATFSCTQDTLTLQLALRLRFVRRRRILFVTSESRRIVERRAMFCLRAYEPS